MPDQMRICLFKDVLQAKDEINVPIALSAFRDNRPPIVIVIIILYSNQRCVCVAPSPAEHLRVQRGRHGSEVGVTGDGGP